MVHPGSSIDVSRGLAPDRRPGVLALVAAATRDAGFRPLSDDLWLDLGADDASRPFLALTLGATQGATPQAYAHAALGTSPPTVQIVVDPDVGAARRDQLTAAALQRLATEPALRGRFDWLVFGVDEGHVRVARACGFVAAQEVVQMRVGLPLAESTDLTTRPFRPGIDEDAWLDVNRRAFAGHAQGRWSRDDLLAREAQPWFDREGFLLLDADPRGEVEGQAADVPPRLAGFCWTKVHRDDGRGDDRPVGEIYVIAVDPELHGLGLGRALVLAGLQHLHRGGVDDAMLFVDGANAPALALYRSLGFVEHRVDRVFALGSGAS